MSATGCYKCGKPGHWSRDCPFSPPQNPNNISNPPPAPPPSSFHPNSGGSGPRSGAPKSAPEKPKKLPRSRPKLTPELLLSDEGLGYVLRYFPSQFTYRGRGHEVQDLGNLLRLYSEWHSRFLPYYSFQQFIQKLEKVAATRRVKTCLGELRERVANGGDPTKLREPAVVHDLPADEQEVGEASHQERDVFPESQNVSDMQEDMNVNDMQEDMLNDVYDKATEEPPQSVHSTNGASMASKSRATEETSNEVPNNGASLSSKAEITEEQRARIEANRLKAQERRADITEEQRARMEANRLKALEKLAARASLSQAS